METKKNHSNPLRSSLENHTRSLNKMGKAYTRLQTKTTQKPYPKGCRNLYSLYKEVSLPRVTVFFMLKMSTITREYRQLIVTLRWVKKVQLYIELLCWLVSLRDRGFNHSTQSCSSCALRGMILVNLVCSKTRQTLTDYLTFADKNAIPLTVSGNSSHVSVL